MNSRRLLYIDKLKALAMMLVVMGHTIYFCMYHEGSFHDPIFSVISSFHVPLFLFLSGFVITTLPDIHKFFVKARRFLVPMLLVGFVNALLIGRVKAFFVDSGHNGYWYLLTLTVFYMMLLPFNLNRKRTPLYHLLLDALIALMVWMVFYGIMKCGHPLFNALNCHGSFVFWPYFILGYLVRKHHALHFLTDSWGVTIFSAALYLVLLALLFSQINYLPIYLEMSVALSAIIALTGLFKKMEKATGRRAKLGRFVEDPLTAEGGNEATGRRDSGSDGENETWVNSQLLLIGNHTLDIYIYHYFFIRFINIDFVRAYHPLLELAFISILTLMIVYASMGVGMMIRKIGKWRKWKKAWFLLLVAIPIMSMAGTYDENNYRPSNSGVKLEETNLPIVFIDTGHEVIHKDYRVAVGMTIIDNAEGWNYGDTLAHANQRVDYRGTVALKYRGNSSFSLSPKKPYSFKTLMESDVESEKVDVELLGMPADRDWVLLAPYNDRSMIRDVLMFELARPYFEYTPRARYCELVVDGIYYGVYVLAERPSKGRNRLDLRDPGSSGDALTGGYQLEIDRQDEEHWYVSKYPAVDKNGKKYGYWNEISFVFKHPEYDEMMPRHPERLEYIEHQIDLMEDALASPDFKDEEVGYRKYLDVTSFMDQQLTQEVANNVDAYRLSTILYKHRDSRDGRFKTTLWDFNIALGNARFCGGDLTDFWVYQNTYLTNFNAQEKVPFWWMRMMEDPEYVRALKGRWKEYREGFYSDEHIEATIDSLVRHLDMKGARQRNFEAWPLWNVNVWPVPDWEGVNSWEKEIAYLRSWLSKRMAWMDQQLGYDNSGSGIDVALTDGFDKQITGYYNMQGMRVGKPQAGFVIVRYKDGSSRKVRK